MSDKTAPSFGAAMPDGNTTIDDGDEFDWDAAEPLDRIDDFLGDAPLTPDISITDEHETPEIDPSIAEGRERSAKAKAYEKEVKNVLRSAFTVLALNPKTTADAAVVLQHGPALAAATGDYAAESEWVAKAIGFLDDTTTTPALSLLAVAVPMGLQIMRNHEPTAEVVTGRRFRLGKREFRLRFRVKLPARFRMWTKEPKEYAAEVFGDPKVQKALAKRGLKIVPR